MNNFLPPVVPHRGRDPDVHASTHWYCATDRWTVSAVIAGIAAMVVTTGCAPVRLPVGPGEEAPETAFIAQQEATERFCSFPGIGERATITAAMSVRGTASGGPVRGRVWVGVDPRYRSLRLESAEGLP